MNRLLGSSYKGGLFYTNLFVWDDFYQLLIDKVNL